jgi:glycine oxidase
MKNAADTTIIGSGIIGLLIAKELNQAGVSVAIVEKNSAPQEASWAGGGILLPLYPWRQAAAITQLVIPSLKKYPLLNDELHSATGIDPEWTDCGLLISKNPDIELATTWCENNQIPFESADQSFFEHLNTQALNPLWLPSIAQARNPRLLKSLKTFLQQQGVVFIENCTVTEIVKKDKRIESIKTNTGTFTVNHLVIAAGAWSAELTKNLFSKKLKKPQIAPVKGQMLLFQAQPDTLPYMVLDGDCYLIPRRDGKIIAGSSVEHSGFDKATTEQTKSKLKAFAFELFPTLKDFFLLAHWAGLRPGTEKGVPYIDNHPEIENLSINAGHFRNGLTMAPASAQLMADLILKRTPSIDPSPYQLTRSE